MESTVLTRVDGLGPGLGSYSKKDGGLKKKGRTRRKSKGAKAASDISKGEADYAEHYTPDGTKETEGVEWGEGLRIPQTPDHYFSSNQVIGSM